MAMPRESVLDRLIDENVGGPEPPPSRGRILARIRTAVQRDLEDLLNTRYRCVAWPPRRDELDNSLMNFGLPDFTAAGLDLGRDSDTLLEAVRMAIDLFEPRLRDVVVEPSEDTSRDRTLRFRIRGTLRIDPDDHPVQFDSTLESATGQFDIG